MPQSHGLAVLMMSPAGLYVARDQGTASPVRVVLRSPCSGVVCSVMFFKSGTRGQCPLSAEWSCPVLFVQRFFFKRERENQEVPF